ncbi:MAG: hypothetical protein KBD63_06925 [Bacteriovoracaceae bacterium]|nr:hypothetical protein [Bacteriovoracaceae bacterium]
MQTLEIFKWGKAYQNAVVLHLLHISIFLTAYIANIILQEDYIGLAVVTAVIAFLLFCKFHVKMLKKIYYAFWTFSVALFFLYFLSLVQNIFSHYLITTAYAVSIILFLIECYILSSPLFFPRIRWWEYDFRFRGDLRVLVKALGEEVKARLTDLRRGAGCVVLFKDVPIGGVIEIETIHQGKPFVVSAQIVTKREYWIGRGFAYGVLLISENKEQEKMIKEFINFWKKNHSVRIRSKFKNINAVS